MRLFEFAIELQTRLADASEADVGHALLTRGRTVRDKIASMANHLEAVQSYRITIGRTDTSPLDTEKMRKEVDHFRRVLAKSGLKALQQDSAAMLEGVLTAHMNRVDRWVKSTWSENFDDIQALLDRVNSGDLHGSPTDRIKACNRVSTIQFVQKTDPVKERAKLETRLNAEGLIACLARLKELIEELQEAVSAIDSAQAKMAPAVQVALQRAISDGGLPLGEVTPELLFEFQSTGVMDDLVVRRL